MLTIRASSFTVVLKIYKSRAHPLSCGYARHSYTIDKLFPVSEALSDVQILEDEQSGEDDLDDGDVLELEGDGLENDMRDDTDEDTVCNAVSERHGNDAHECREGFGDIVPLEVLDGAHHQNADVDQSSTGGGGGDVAGERSEQQSGEEAQSGNKRGQTGLAAGGDAGAGLDEGGNGGGTEYGAHGGGDSVGEHGVLHSGKIAVLIEHAGLGGGADESADGVEHIDEGEGKDDDEYGENGVQNRAGACEQTLEALGERLAEGYVSPILELGDDGGEIDGSGRHGDDAGGNADQPVQSGGSGNAEKDGARYLEAVEHTDDEQAGKAHDGYVGRLTALEDALDVEQSEEGSIVIDDEADVLEADKGDEQADTDRDRYLEVLGDSLHDRFAKSDSRDEYEQQTGNEYDGESLCIGVAVGYHDGVGKERVESHAGCEREGKVCEQSHEQSACE